MEPPAERSSTSVSDVDMFDISDAAPLSSTKTNTNSLSVPIRKVTSTSPHSDEQMGTMEPNGSLCVLLDDNLRLVMKCLAPGAGDDEQDYSLVAVTSRRLRRLALEGLIWEAACRRRWKHKHGFKDRWSRALGVEKSVKEVNGYWYRRYAAEEVDARRNQISSRELHGFSFSLKTWFGTRSYPPGAMFAANAMRSGMNGHSLSDAAKFSPNGILENSNIVPIGSNRITYYYHDEEETKINIYEQRNLDEGNDKSIDFYRTFYIVRTKKWGWELRSNVFVFRSLDNSSKCNVQAEEELWDDYIRSLIIEHKPEGAKYVRKHRCGKYQLRIVPADSDLRVFLEW